MMHEQDVEQRLREMGDRLQAQPSLTDEVMRRIDQVEIAPGIETRRYRLMHSRTSKWAIPVAAAIAISLTAGLFLGSGWSRMTATPRLEKPSGDPVPIQVARLKGTVLVKRGLNAAWNELTSASPLYVGDVFQSSPKSEMTLSFKDGSTLVLSANSRLALDHYNGGVRLNLSAGGMKASLNSPHPPFIVSTPSGELEALGTEFTVSVE